MGRTSVTFYIGFDPEQNSGSHLICGSYFSCPAPFFTSFLCCFSDIQTEALLQRVAARENRQLWL